MATYEATDGTHYHKCANPDCGIIWQHLVPANHTDREYDAAHACPDCGWEQRYKMPLSELNKPGVRVKYPWRGFINSELRVKVGEFDFCRTEER